MSRSKGTFNFAANFEGLLKAPIDSRQLVGTYADLTSPATWSGATGVWLYSGAMVVVGSDPISENNGIYWLSGTNYQNTTNWIKAGSGVDIDTLTGATNGLTVNGNLVELGGIITTGDTVIFTDNRPTPVGLQYYGDYSSTFTARSLVDKGYVDGVSSGLQPKQAVRVATTGDTVLSGLTTVDGVLLTTGDRVLVKNQISGVTNGVYSATTGSWGRTADFDGTPPSEVVTGSYMWVLTGDTNMNTAWVLDTPSPVIGLSALTFVLFSAVQDVLGIEPIVVTQSTGVHYVGMNSAAMNIYNTAITGATSGLHVANRKVKLGGGLATGSTFIELSALTKTNVVIGQDGTNWLGGRLEVCLDNRIVGSQVSGNSAFIGARYDAYNQSSVKFGSTTGMTISSCIGGTPHVLKLGNNALVYGANYCADYTNRTLVDKQYVDNASGSISAANGLRRSGNYIVLGGVLTGNTIVSGGTKSFCIGSTASPLNAFRTCSISTIIATSGNSAICSSVGNIVLNAGAASSGITVTSPVTGAIYTTNYAAGFVNRSLVDKQYVDNKVSGSTNMARFTSDITVSIASGKTFGRYRNLDVIPASGKTANEVILMSLNEPLVPILTLDTSSNSVSFGLAAKIVNVNFTYKLKTIGATVASALLEYNRGAGWLTLSTGTATGGTYIHNINDSGNRFNTTAITYRYTVVDSAAASAQTTTVVTPEAYAAPTIAPTYVGSIQSYETQTAREVGNKNTDVAGSITSNRSLVNLTGYTIQRNVNGGGWTTLTTVTFAGALTKTITSYNDTSASGAATSILYRVVAYDEYTSTIGSTYTIGLLYTSYYGYSTNTSLSSAQIVALGNQGLLSSRVRTMTLTAPVSNYTYVGYPASYGDLTSAIMDGASPVLGAFTKLTAVTVTNFYGQTVSTNVYKSNATNAFTANSVAFA